jgi:PAS domain S-box-containing protein
MKQQNFLPETKAKSVWKAFAVLILGLCLTFVSAYYAKRDIEEQRKKEFSEVCNELKTKIIIRLNVQAQLLRSGSALFAASVEVSRNEWKSFVESSGMNENLPGIQGVGFSLIISRNQLEKHIQQINTEGYPQYSVRPAGDRDRYTSIIYLEPFTGRNLRAFGYDMYSEPIRKKAMDQACDENIAALSGKVILVQETDKDLQAGTLMYVPVYRNGMPVATVTERRTAIIGWVYSPYRMHNLLQGILGRWESGSQNNIRLQVYDDDRVSLKSLLFDSQPHDTIITDQGSTISLTIPVVFNGKQWSCRFTQSAGESLYFQHKAVIVLISGIVISFLLFGLLLSSVNTAIRAQHIAEKLTYQLRESQQQLKTVADFASDWEYWTGKDSRIIYMSPSSTRITGYAPDEFLTGSMLLINVVHPGDLNIFIDHTKTTSSLEYRHLSGNLDFRILKKDGTITYISHLCVPVYDDEGNYDGRRSSNRDITDRKQAEFLLQESESRFREVLENSLDASYKRELKTSTYDYLSPVFGRLSGYTPEEIKNLPGKTFFELISPEDIHELERVITKSVTGMSGTPYQVDYRLKHKDGEFRWLHDQFIVTRDEQGNPAAMIGSVGDISHRKRLENELKDEKNRLSYILKGTNAGTWEWNILTGETIFNERWAEIVGYSLDELSPVNIDTWGRITHPDDLQEAEKLLEKHFTGESDYYECEVRMKHKNGDWIWVLDRGKVHEWDQEGRPSLMSGTHSDITRSKVLEGILRESELRFRLVADSAPVLIWKSGPDTLCDYFNQPWLDFTGRTIGQELGNGWAEGVHADDLQNCLDIYLKAFDAHESFKMEYRLRRADGEYRWVLDHGIPRFASGGTFVGYIGSCVDITERKEAENELTRLKNSLEKNVVERTHQLNTSNKELKFRLSELGQFAYIASHDLQEPLRNLTNFTQLFLEEYGGKLDENGNKYIEFISGATDRMRELVTGLLYYVILGKESVKTDIDCNVIVNEVLLKIDDKIKEIDARVNLQELPVLNGYQKELSLLFQNLIENAIKFRRMDIRTEITISVENIENEWKFAVEDNGIGIMEQNNEKVFIIFKQMHNRNKYEGTGIGLAHCKKIVELHDGRIWVESAPEMGSIFYFTIPKQ